MPQQKREKLLASPHELHHSIQPGPHQIPHRLVDLVRHPDGGQPAGTMLNDQLLRIPSVGFDPLARLFGNQRRRSNRTTVTEFDQLSVDAIATTSSFIAKLQSVAVFGQTLAKLR
jgi:hypothetical protein